MPAVPRFYRELGKYATESYIRRKNAGSPTGHFSVRMGKLAYVFWKVGYDAYGNPVSMRPKVELAMRKFKRQLASCGVKDMPGSADLYYMSINKPE